MSSEHEHSLLATTSNKNADQPGFVGRFLITYGIGALFLLLAVLIWFPSPVVLLVFASILMTVLLHDVCNKVGKRIRVSRAGRFF